MILFVDRVDELSFLEERFKSGRAELIVIYGRRRIGKTELIKQFMKDKDGFYFLARKQNMDLELERFGKKFGKKFNIFMESRTWDDIFEVITKFIRSERFVIAIDEFSYWMDKEPAICSILQSIWDESLSKTRCFMILCGSTIGMMESLLTYGNPLYGRRTGQWKVDQLSFFDINSFFPNYDIEELIKAYACVSGIPQYLLEFNPEFSVKENIEETFLNKGNILYDDAERILKDELREPIVYLNIMERINDGETTMSEISKKTKVDITNLSKYINVLKRMGLLKKEYPPTVVERKKRKGIYRIADNYFRFWLRFIHPFKDEIEIGNYRFESFENKFNRYLGEIFEDISKQFLIQLNKNKKLPFTPLKIGRWWYKDKEIDIIALNDKSRSIAFFECKWSHLRENECRSILEELKEKSRHVKWFEKERKNHFGIIAKEIKGKNRLRRDGFLVYDLEDMKIYT